MSALIFYYFITLKKKLKADFLTIIFYFKFNYQINGFLYALLQDSSNSKLLCVYY